MRTVSSENSLEVSAQPRQLCEQLLRDRDDVTADRIGLEDVQELARAGPDQLAAAVAR